ncbi:type IV secretory system conjugative DNA transfer family protein [Bariatricus massiliensis]|uniref:Type IV secretory system conjugative DNA transfer family protein n=1 Tax=Bariatricus massiliensis TaxID=1745713 RepID=A0ABS8DBA3_9FIRM|nr:type IV secretory system conjugative DNA transfer family protein [Bariatricus massiliensis]MCB7303616.1 type IV secretory system conjugative DNA transfer family protein [Bariatricus massiliensis]MCB7373031.1 type IV secretory system conjugative DNA transfer family protein [Bariatricus massiliensis]MCB7385701.1 type IV secretory system conjugative DNA transfer family protein [Bariatricus massiliensis]MCB7409864.1 type IV secretory system conjugative DNA transfer family protein [Bariatricus ma
MNEKIRKYLLPNLPYLMVFWFFAQLGEAYRLAAGADFAHKLIGMVAAINPALQTIGLGLAPLDWLVGLAGAVTIRLVVYSKVKKSKKFRRDLEYGSARWGTPADIKPFVDPNFQNNVILTGTEFLTLNTRPKIPANARNLNCCIIGSSGSGKTRFWLTPQLLQAHSSYVTVDPKGGVLDQCGKFLERQGYKIRVFNSVDFKKSMHYNPLAYIKTESDVLKFVNALINNTKGDGKEGDPFWTKAETLLYCALIAYIVFEGPEEERNMNTLVEMINSMEVREDDDSFKNAVDYMFDGLAKRDPQHFAVRQYAKYKLASGVVSLKRLLNQSNLKSWSSKMIKKSLEAYFFTLKNKIVFCKKQFQNMSVFCFVSTEIV